MLDIENIWGYIIAGIFVLFLFWGLNYLRNENAIESKVFSLVNSERSIMGKNLLIRNAQLDSLAKRHSDYMATTEKLEHSHDNVGENIVDIPISLTVEGCLLTITDDQVAACMFSSWKNSPAHYSNMINSQYRFTGIGVSCGMFNCKGTENFS